MNANTLDLISGIHGNDIYPIGTYKLSNGSMKKPIFAICANSADSVISGVKIDLGDGSLKSLTSSDFNWLSTGNLTESMGYMVFGEPIVEIVIATADIKVFYIEMP